MNYRGYQPRVHGRKRLLRRTGDSGRCVRVTFRLQTRRVWNVAIRAEKSFPRAPVCGHVARLFSRKIEGARTPEEEGGGERERSGNFSETARSTKGKPGLDENPSPAFQPITQANFWFSVYVARSRAVTTGMKVSCGGKGELALRARCAKWKKISWRRGVSPGSTSGRRAFFFFFFLFLVLSVCNWNFSTRRESRDRLFNSVR